MTAPSPSDRSLLREPVRVIDMAGQTTRDGLKGAPSLRRLSFRICVAFDVRGLM